MTAGIDMQPVNSSNVDAVGYNADRKELVVFFKSGARWVYYGITEAVHRAMMEADSIGSYLRKSVIPAASSAVKIAEV